MFEDRNGNSLLPGDVVAVRMQVTNLIEDSIARNLVVRHYDHMTGLPDDYRLTLDSAQVERLIQAQQPEPVPQDPTPAPGPEAAPISATPEA